MSKYMNTGVALLPKLRIAPFDVLLVVLWIGKNLIHRDF